MTEMMGVRELIQIIHKLLDILESYRAKASGDDPEDSDDITEEVRTAALKQIAGDKRVNYRDNHAQPSRLPNRLIRR